MGFLDCHTDVERREHCEDKCLDVGNQTLQHTDKDTEDDRDDRHASTHTHRDGIADNEDDDYKAKYDDMSSRHVSKESDHEDDGFGENTHQFDNRHKGENLEPCGDTRGIEDVDPVVLVATEIGDKESNDSKGCCDSKIARYIGTGREEGYQAHAVGEEDEEEKGEHVGQVFFVVLLPYHGPHNTVAHEDHEHFH